MSSFVIREYKFEQNSKMCAAYGCAKTAVATSQPPEYKKDPHTMALCSLRKLIKPLVRLIRKKQLLRKTLAEIQEQNAINSSLEDMRKDPAALSANDDNLANEALEQRIYNEIRHCGQNAAVIVQQGENQHVVAVQPQQQYIPVHFVRTSSGTFFWTSMDMTRQQELLLRAKFDRWGQA